MTRLALCAVLATLVTACGPANSGSLGAAPKGSAAPTASASVPAAEPVTSPPSRPSAPGSPAPGDGGSGRTLTFGVWLVRDGALFVTSRTRPAEVATGRLALRTLIEGPTAGEAAAGVTSPIATGTRFDISLRSGVATVDLPAAFYAGGRDLARLRQAQVVYTLTQYPTITKVGFLKDGSATGWPLGRADYADKLPRILVVSPVIGQRVASPVTIAGTADVYEATVSVRILDARGSEIATRFTTASGGTGTRGSYSVAVPFRVAATQRGTIEAFSVSPKDGTRTHVVRIPVTLAR